jgi:glycosyltransferase involved in cell wall biosynthesis
MTSSAIPLPPTGPWVSSPVGQNRPPLVLDLQAAQSITYRDRGVARYVLDYAKAILRVAPEFVDQLLVRPDLLPTAGLDPFLSDSLVTTVARWDRTGGLFHAMSPFDLDTPVRDVWPRQASRTGARLVVTVYDLIPEIFPDLYLTDPGTRHRYRVRREIVRIADHVMTLSRSAADDVVDRLGLPDHRVSVVGAACSEVFTPGRGGLGSGRTEDVHVARQLVPGLGERFVVYNGAIEPRKNVDRLLEAFSLVAEPQRAGRQLVLVCRLEPPQRHHYEVLADRLGIADQLLLAGAVSDTELVALYRGAELVVYPSHYEGYGLPVAEAMACGAPVVGSATSSVQELLDPDGTFDPGDVDDMSRAIGRGLSDEKHRERLRRWSAGSRPSWDDVAAKAVDVYHGLVVDRRSGRQRPPAAWRKRPVVGFITPWPPAPTGVARYSFHLVEAMSRLVDVDVFVDGEPDRRSELDGQGGLDRRDGRLRKSAPTASHIPLYPTWALTRIAQVHGGYDAVVACIGNSHHHVGALRALRLEGVRASVLAHDVRLTGLYHHGAARGAVPEGYAAAAERMYPMVGDGALVESWVPEQAAARGIVMAREVIGLSERFLVTSSFAAELAQLDAEPSDQERVGVVSFGYPAPERRTERNEEAGLVCSFGIVNEVKRPLFILEAFALVSREDPRTRLAYVGPVGDAILQRCRQTAEDLGLAERVLFTGEVSDEDYEGWLRRASVAVQLRSSTNGETSAAIADCISHGLPTIVSEVGSARELPAFVEKISTDASGEVLASRVKSLLADSARRRAVGEEGLRFAGTHSFDRAADELIAVLLATAPTAGELVLPSGRSARTAMPAAP